MRITLWDFSKRVNSTKIPTTQGTVSDVFLKEDTSRFSPVFEINNVDNIPFNYLKFEDRFYYITNVVCIANDVYQLECSIDVLGTWRGQIASTTGFKLYSSVGFDTDIPDTRLSTVSSPTFSTSSGDLYTNSKRYIINYVTTHPTVGGSGLVVVNSFNAKSIANEITNTDLLNALKDLQKSFQSCYDSVISCIQVPFDLSSGSNVDIYLGDYNIGVKGGIPEDVVSFDLTLNIPWQFNDWRNRSGYTSLIIYLPAVGYVELNPDDFIGKTFLKVRLSVSGLDGTGAYNIENIMRVPVNFGVYVPMNGLAYNSVGFVGNAVSSLSSALVGDTTGTIASGFNAIKSSTARATGTGGSYSGSACYLAPIGYTSNEVTLTTICHDTTIMPSSINAVQGQPVNAVGGVTSGYNEFVNASVECNAPNDLKEQINGYLNGGFYYE